MANSMVQWLITASVALLHPFFVSVIDISHNEKDATAEISVRIFTDDLEKTLQKYSKAKVDIIHPADKAFIDQQLNTYINNTLHLKINGVPAKPKYIGYEIIKESTWAYFEVAGVKELKKLDVDCSLLHDFETSQINIFHVKSKGQEKSYKLDHPKRVTSFDF
ncbi:MAG: hypothetical protein I8H66_09000 [Sphingobacteriia bacterium]|nr:hypothetical protein [Sphingobacteriia bacterium]